MSIAFAFTGWPKPVPVSSLRDTQTRALDQSYTETGTVDSLPLAAGGFLKFEFVPVGPLAPSASCSRASKRVHCGGDKIREIGHSAGAVCFTL